MLKCRSVGSALRPASPHLSQLYAGIEGGCWRQMGVPRPAPPKTMILMCCDSCTDEFPRLPKRYERSQPYVWHLSGAAIRPGVYWRASRREPSLSASGCRSCQSRSPGCTTPRLFEPAKAVFFRGKDFFCFRRRVPRRGNPSPLQRRANGAPPDDKLQAE